MQTVREYAQQRDDQAISDLEKLIPEIERVRGHEEAQRYRDSVADLRAISVAHGRVTDIDRTLWGMDQILGGVRAALAISAVTDQFKQP